MYIIRYFFFLFLVLIYGSASSQAIIPAPVEQTIQQGKFLMTERTQIVVTSDQLQVTAAFLNQHLKKYHGLQLPVVKKKSFPSAGNITLSVSDSITPNKEAYQLLVNQNQITITGNSAAGVFYGMQSLLQLLPASRSSSIAVPAVSINDHPRFSYRGMHLDVARHFFPVDYIKRYIDFLALHKLNTFHWHLTDDQGWRIEIKKYPKLTSIGGYRNGTIIGRYPGKGNDSIRYGGFYTQQEIKEVVKYAADRFITVIPEIEMPGHASAAIAAYPHLSCFPNEPTTPPFQTAWNGSFKGKQVPQAWGIFPDVFCAGKESTFSFLQDVVDEVMVLFPSAYIHIGGDENDKNQWKRCPACQARIKRLKLKDEKQLQAYFVQRMERYINSKGRKIIGWNEILEGGLAPNATVMSWQGERGGIEAAKQQHDVIMVPENYLYFNWSQTRNEDFVSFGRYTPLEKVYAYDPVPKALNSAQAKYIWGGQGALWTEYIKNTSILEYNLFPRLAALSEILWSSTNNWKDFQDRLPHQLKRYDHWGINYSRAYYEIQDSVLPGNDHAVLRWKLSASQPGSFSIDVFDNKKQRVNAMNTAGATEVLIAKPGEYTAVLKPDVGASLTRSFSINKATGKRIQLKEAASSTYPGNGGAFGLINGIKAKMFNSLEWQGWSGKDMEATIDLLQAETLSKVVVNVWRQEPSWFYLPVAIQVSTSPNGNTWTTITITNKDKQWNVQDDRTITIELPASTTARFVKVIARNYGKIPAGRPGAGRNAWLFVDEIEIH
ncbi:glycoside hydrolase family 20 protein [Aridibaculum aurantiacum]|uniref:glycoside hydrolase family 20 protein n=1 Tax=Aridibaculum aurantiacum TaxID=2810307 RepID=UPI001A9612EB|nr:family 20 glycosylhydrolase [Aridibaculum aurantiacum]